MPIDTDVETKEKCFGTYDKNKVPMCELRCCFVEMELCAMETDENKGIIKDLDITDFEEWNG